MENPIAYSVRAATKAFVPPISEKRLRDAIKNGLLTAHEFGRRSLLLHSDLEDFVRSLPATKQRGIRQ